MIKELSALERKALYHEIMNDFHFNYNEQKLLFPNEEFFAGTSAKNFGELLEKVSYLEEKRFIEVGSYRNILNFLAKSKITGDFINFKIEPINIKRNQNSYNVEFSAKKYFLNLLQTTYRFEFEAVDEPSKDGRILNKIKKRTQKLHEDFQNGVYTVDEAIYGTRENNTNLCRQILRNCSCANIKITVNYPNLYEQTIYNHSSMAGVYEMSSTTSVHTTISEISRELKKLANDGVKRNVLERMLFDNEGKFLQHEFTCANSLIKKTGEPIFSKNTLNPELNAMITCFYSLSGSHNKEYFANVETVYKDPLVRNGQNFDTLKKQLEENPIVGVKIYEKGHHKIKIAINNGELLFTVKHYNEDKEKAIYRPVAKFSLTQIKENNNPLERLNNINDYETCLRSICKYAPAFLKFINKEYASPESVLSNNLVEVYSLKTETAIEALNLINGKDYTLYKSDKGDISIYKNTEKERLTFLPSISQSEMFKSIISDFPEKQILNSQSIRNSRKAKDLENLISFCNFHDTYDKKTVFRTIKKNLSTYEELKNLPQNVKDAILNEINSYLRGPRYIPKKNRANDKKKE